MSNFESKNLIDYFSLCGLDVKCGLESEHNTDSYEEIIVKPPLERSYKCRMLYHFPENLPWNPFDEDAVAQLCFPNGLVFQKHSSKPRFHPFIITREDGSRVYGATLQFYELIEDESICNAMQTLQRMYDAEYTTPTSTISSSRNGNGTGSSGRPVYSRSSTSSTAVTSSSFESPVVVRHSLNLQDNNGRSPLSTPVSRYEEDEFTPPPSQPPGDQLLSPSVFLSDNGDGIGGKTNGQQSSAKQKLLSGHNRHNYANLSNHHHHHSSSSSQSPCSSKVSHYNMLKDRLYACKCICLISQQPFNRAFAKILHTLYEMVERTDLLGIRLEMHLHNLIYDIPMPAPGQLVKAHIGCKACYVLAPGANDLPLLDYDLLEFFRILGVHNAINLYLTTLLEHQILLYSKDYNLLMFVAESLTALLFPFQWIKTYVPIVPASNLHFIEAPLPYIMGFHHKDIDKEFFKQGQRCFVDIDSGTVSCPEGLPEFPDKNKFIKEINDLLVHFQEKRNKLLKSSRQTAVEMAVASTSRRDSKSEQGGVCELTTSVPNDANGSNLDILQNSQAFARIAELALKAGALDSSQDYFKAANRPTFNVSETPPSCSSGYSSGESTLTPNDTTKLSDYVSLSRRNSTQTPENSSRTSSGEDNDELALISAQFNACIRELFLLKFVQMFASYEKFVIVPTNIDAAQIDQWWMQREYSGVNFDSKMFLIEQPSPRLPFLSHFIATQMFVSFIDAKIISVIDADSSRNAADCLGVHIFDQRIRAFHDTAKTTEPDSVSSSVAAAATRALFNVESIERDVARKYAQEPLVAPSVKAAVDEPSGHEADDYCNKKECRYLFEHIDHSLLKADEDLLKKIYAEMKLNKENLLKKREQSRSSQLKLNSLERTKTTKERKARKPSDVTKQSKKSTPVIISSESIEKTTEINPIFIHSLLKESKSKTKRMLVEKMPEAANLGHGEARISGVEENMLIASLCDLIERIWGHGLHNKALSGKSALWNHLNNYRKLIQYLHPNSNLVADAKNTSPRSCTLPRKQRYLLDEGKYSPNQHQSLHRMHGGGSTANLTDGGQKSAAHKRASSVVGNGLDQNQNTFPPLKNDLLADLARIDKLTEVKTEIGMARAFVRLSLEKKLLADHLRQLLSEAELLRALYKKHAFLRQEDEREQFIYHLQSLNVVDYFCFTDHFKSIPTDYSVLIVPSKKFSSSYTSANPYMKLFGSLGESDFIAIPRNTFEFTISCKNNLGPLTTLIVGHDNAGITPKWMIECIFVRNEITGHIHKFPCGRWLGKGVDDDSLERLLIAEPLDHNESYDLPNIQLLSPYSSTTTRSRSPTIIRADEKKLSPQAIQELLGNAINILVKYFEKSEPERGSLTSLMCGDSGLVFCMDHVFSFGYKSYKLFKRLYVWDFLEKAAVEYENIYFAAYSSGNTEKQLKYHLQIEKYISVIRSINSTSANYGKDGKFQIFICLACRDSFLADWFQLLSKSNTASQMYDEYSFLRNHELHKLCMKLLSITNQFNFKLENSLTMGINY